MSVTLKSITAAAATAVLAASIGVATSGAATAATPSCGTTCISVYSTDFTNGLTAQPAFILDVYKRQQIIGAPIILFRTSNTDPAEDFTVSDQGTVSDYLAAGLVSQQVALHYGCVTTPWHSCTQPDGTTYRDEEAYEVEYAPYGADTGLCVGVATTAAAGTKVTLQPCGVSSKTVWILDSFDHNIGDGQAPVINGSDMDFSHPFVLTYPASGYPTDLPRDQFYTANLTGSAAGVGPVEGTVDSNQLISAVFGPRP